MKYEKQESCFSRIGKEQFLGQDEFQQYYIASIQKEDNEKMSNHVHWHRWFEFFICLDGSADFEYAGEKCTLDPGDALFVNVGIMHKKELHDCKGIIITISPEFIGNQNFFNSFIYPVIHEGVLPGMKLIGNDAKQKQVIDLLMELYELKENEDETLPLIIISNFTRIWKYFYDHLMIEKGKIYVDPQVKTMQRMIMYIKENYQDNISSHDIADSENISISTCIRLFQKYTYITPCAYVNLYRLVKAKEMLKESNYNMTEIAERCGFQSSAYFTKMFKKQFGKTPSEYRKK